MAALLEQLNSLIDKPVIVHVNAPNVGPVQGDLLDVYDDYITVTTKPALYHIPIAAIVVVEYKKV
jgi:hypothetical protein